MMRIGAKDRLDKALVKQYANIQTSNLDDSRMDSEEMWEKMNLFAMGQKALLNF